MIGKTIFKIERREAGYLAQVLSVVIALIISLIISAGLIASSGANVSGALGALFKGSLGSKDAFFETLVQASPIILTGLAMAIAFRGKVWNIGGEGQFFAGALATAWICMNMSNLPQPLLIIVVVLASMIAGGIWGFIPGVLKAKLGISEIIVTVMMNYIMQYFVSYLLNGPWQGKGDHFLQTPRFAESTYLPTFFDSRIHLGFWLALILVAAIYILLWKTPLGYEIRAVGDNPTTSKYKGISINLVVMSVMALSGAIAGLAGGTELAGLHHRLRLDISTGYGYTGILIALLGRLSPIGVIPAAVFFGALVNGSTSMQIRYDVPVALVYSIQGIVIVILLIADALTKYRIRRVHNVG
ncbi:MAG: ABC transporter permease [Leptolinea sp.]